MNIRPRIAGDFVSMLCLGLLLAMMMLPAAAGGGSVRLINGRRLPSASVQPDVPQTGRPLYSPPGFVDRSPPISERPFARPFIDRGPSPSDRPLAPIGGGAQVAPKAGALVWCQGGWVKPDSFGCPSR
jgi:hypothetical protein